jgi:hypothetical protein
MEDTCTPGKNKSIQTYRIYSIVIPAVILTVIIEAFYVIGNIPGNLGSALTIKGSLPPIPSAPMANAR